MELIQPVQFFRAFALSKNTLCSEPVVAWAVERGFRDTPIEDQRSYLAEHGAEDGAALVAESMGLRPVSADDIEEGDAVLLTCGDGAVVLGVKAAGAFSVASTNGRVHIGRFAVKRGWSLRA